MVHKLEFIIRSTTRYYLEQSAAASTSLVADNARCLMHCWRQHFC